MIGWAVGWFREHRFFYDLTNFDLCVHSQIEISRKARLTISCIVVLPQEGVPPIHTPEMDYHHYTTPARNFGSKPILSPAVTSSGDPEFPLSL